jgi:hypothetical protein
VDQDTVVVILVEGISADVGALVDDERASPELGRGAFGESESGETGSNDEEIELHG